MISLKEAQPPLLERRRIVRRKVLAIGKMSRAYMILKDCPELVNELKALSVNGKIPAGVLSQGEEGIKEAIHSIVATQH
ncbi:hypothetical protein BY458DRAFT_557996 [Sporodiniella umbellata]|nr:hypothetical protein BY458DRAFT_557996 [Sporodiniella umbellata]